MSEPVRLSRRVIELTGCSRREAELYIEGGWVSVDGEVVDRPQAKVTGEQVTLLPGARAEPLEPVSLMRHQPAGDAVPGEARELFSAGARWAEDSTGMRLLAGHFVRLETALPLQAGASGLVVYSQDWRTLRKLRADAAKLEQEYVVEVSGTLAEQGLERLKRGNPAKGLPPCKASWQSEQRLRFALKDPAPGVIRALCQSVGLSVVTLKRIRIGALSMGKLPSGGWRYLAPHERF